MYSKTFALFKSALGGDASPIEANAAERLTLYNSRFQSQLACSDRGYVSARAASKNNYVVLHGVYWYKCDFACEVNASNRVLSPSMRYL